VRGPRASRAPPRPARDTRPRRRATIVIFEQADHAFFNHTGPRFNAPAAAEAWHRTLEWFARFAD
jgi:dienelactone hydrolase